MRAYLSETDRAWAIHWNRAAKAWAEHGLAEAMGISSSQFVDRVADDIHHAS